jgi:hypothetical protein
MHYKRLSDNYQSLKQSLMDCDGRIGKGFIIRNSRRNKGDMKCFGIGNKAKRKRLTCQDLR